MIQSIGVSISSDIDSSDIISIIALVASVTVPVIIFHFTQTRNKRSEQVRICREIWDGIGIQNRSIHDWPLLETEDRKPLKKYMEYLKNDLSYFVFFVEKGEIEDRNVLEYYRTRISEVERNIKKITSMGSAYADIRNYEETKEIQRLVRKYFELTEEKIKS